MTFHPEVMPPVQQDMLRRLGAVATTRGFYLAGGTALAIHVGHRRSVDLDWFSPSTIDPMALAADLEAAGFPVEPTDVEAGTLHGKADGVKLSFLEYRYPNLVPLVEWPAYGVKLAGLQDLACMKLSAIAGRGSKKDFIDIFALGREHFTLEQMLTHYRRKYSVSDLSHTVYALTYFDDAEQEDMPDMLWQTGWEDVRKAIQRWVRAYVQKHAPPQAGGPGSRP